jgi:hypothetical protein
MGSVPIRGIGKLIQQNQSEPVAGQDDLVRGMYWITGKSLKIDGGPLNYLRVLEIWTNY